LGPVGKPTTCLPKIDEGFFKSFETQKYYATQPTVISFMRPHRAPQLKELQCSHMLALLDCGPNRLIIGIEGPRNFVDRLVHEALRRLIKLR
jgi:hypothetical protein